MSPSERSPGMVTGSQTGSLLEAMDFPRLLRWHIDNDRTDDGRLRAWTAATFCDEVAKHYPDGARTYTERAYRDWLNGTSRPSKKALIAMRNVLFKADSPDDRRFVRAWTRFRSRSASASPDIPDHAPAQDHGRATGDPPTARRMRARPIPKPRDRYLADFSIFSGSQGDTPEDFRLFLSMMLGKTPVKWPGGTAWVAATKVAVHLDAPDHTQTRHFNRDRKRPGVEAAAGRWTFTVQPPDTCLDGAPPGITEDDPLVCLTPNGKPDEQSAETEPKNPTIRVFIPDPTNTQVTFDPASDTDTPRSAEAVVAAFLKLCPKDGPHGIALGEASLRWEEER